MDRIKEHLSSQFKEGMSWENYGEWEMDHIIPITYKNPTQKEAEERLHWKNIQPLWQKDNREKYNKYIS